MLTADLTLVAKDETLSDRSKKELLHNINSMID